MRSTCTLGAAALLVALGVHPLAAQKDGARRAFTPNDWYRVTTVSDAALSPDGKLVAFTVTTVNEKEGKRHSEVWVAPTSGCPSVKSASAADADSCAPARYTSPGTESSNPRFSPDGKLLYFDSRRPGGERGRGGRSWALRMDRPGGEAFQVLDAPPASATYTRDGRIAVWSDVDADSSSADSTKKDPWKEMQPMARPPYGAITRPVDARRFDGRHIVDERYKSNNSGFVPGPRHARVWRASQVHLRARGDSVARQLDTTLYSRRGATVSPDGKWIAFVADPELRPDSVVEAESDSLERLPYDSARDEAPRNRSDIFVIPANGGEPRRVADFMGDERQISWSPDGKSIAFVASPERTKSRRIYVVSASGGDPVNVLGDWLYEPSDFEWLPNGEISFSAAIGGRTALLRLDPKSKKVREVLGGRRQLRDVAYDAARRTVAYASTSVDKPTEIYVADIDGKNERRITSFNDSLNAEIAWASSERFTYESVDGLEIEGWLMKPYGYEPGKKYPLVLYIHGGPHSAYGEGWFDEFQNIAGAGMWVLYTNPRGSSGYGADFTYSTRGRWGAEDYEDLMKAVDIAAQRPDVDSTRMGVTGGSYGGFMTAWVTTKTDRFEAAQADRMISDWTYWYGASDAQGLTEFEFYGKP
ncbi:MAG TPA: prolyl oligopeptidase family serine peptidase, partial [Gemmatimonadaceae bacterium]|nr:prolyl oligopeptidase family serine peptidase [Gemmatimonadaceae bacterium]